MNISIETSQIFFRIMEESPDETESSQIIDFLKSREVDPSLLQKIKDEKVCLYRLV